MNRATLLMLIGCLLVSPLAIAENITFLTPDGKPAGGTKFYRTFQDQESGYDMEMMMGGMGDMMMDSDGGGGDMYGMEMEMGGAMGMGMGGGMDMGYGEMGAGAPPSEPHLAFLNAEPLQPITPPQGETWTAADDGTIELNEGSRRRRGVSVHTVSALAVHESGFSFIPADTTLSPKVTLRSGGKIVVAPPSGIDTSRYHVLTCWQNGFAYPSLEEYKQQLGSSQKLGKQLDDDDWRFSPRFRWYQTADLGEVISVPPGEVRVTIVPKPHDASDYADLGAAQIFELLTSRGPSTIVLVSGKTPQPITVDFPPLRSLVLRAPEKSDDALPEWGDQPPPRYHLEPFQRQSYGDTPTLTSPPASAVASRSSMAKFLNERRDERAAYQGVQLPSSTDGRNLRFDLLRPGWYVINRIGEDGLMTRGIPVIDWEQGNGVTTAVLADEKIKGVDGALEFAISTSGRATFRTNQSAETTLGQSASNQRSDAEKLKLIRTMRSEIEATVTRLVQHRKRLLELEAKLQPEQTPTDPLADPFGGPDGMNDPFGRGGSASDDPFGGGSGNASDNPFGEGGSGDSFGGTPGSTDPFSAGDNNGAPSGADPFD
ncbi:hypothetical protein Mal15_10660 [Stieleria maiorica]|uniref:Secreted protein n=1 Tax=Stieleria maiorica TaxID=2795974 RepID=A0A5B9M9Y6_9BACT|nr:hypothetical protein [Stieleria maiorica]QEF97036.1 hypothetical protein Mal15_10660 [Stieleria maiorica]